MIPNGHCGIRVGLVGLAVAGPAAHLLISLLCVIAIHIGVAAGVFYPPDSAGFEVIVATDMGGVWPGVTFVIISS